MSLCGGGGQVCDMYRRACFPSSMSLVPYIPMAASVRGSEAPCGAEVSLWWANGKAWELSKVSGFAGAAVKRENRSTECQEEFL